MSLEVNLSISLGDLDTLDEARLAAIVDGIASLRTRLNLADRPAPPRPPHHAEPKPLSTAPRFVREPDPTPVRDLVDVPPAEPMRQRGAGHPVKVTHADLDALGAKLEWLTVQERTVIRGRASGHSYAEIATLIGSSEKAAAQAFARAVRKLKAPGPPRIRGRRPSTGQPKAVSDGTVWCPLCRLHRTSLHVEQHQAQNAAEQRRIDEGRASIAHLPPDSTVGHGRPGVQGAASGG